MTKEDKALIKKNEEIAKYDYGDHLGAGFEDTTTEDFAMPFLGILQDLSPAVKDGIVEGAKIGMFINTATNELYDGEKGIRAIPCFLLSIFFILFRFCLVRFYWSHCHC